MGMALPKGWTKTHREDYTDQKWRRLSASQKKRIENNGPKPKETPIPPGGYNCRSAVILPKNPYAILIGFTSWLSTREEPVVFSAKHIATPGVELLNHYAKVQGLNTELKEGWENELVPMKDNDIVTIHARCSPPPVEVMILSMLRKEHPDVQNSIMKTVLSELVTDFTRRAEATREDAKNASEALNGLKYILSEQTK